MSDLTCILSQLESGDSSAAEHLLPLVYEELRKLSTARLAHEKPGQTLQATALVHEAYLRLVGSEKSQHWASRGHFFSAVGPSTRLVMPGHDFSFGEVSPGGEHVSRLDSKTGGLAVCNLRTGTSKCLTNNGLRVSRLEGLYGRRFLSTASNWPTSGG
jgi:hypothetical protein